MLYDPRWEVETAVPMILEPWRKCLLKAAKILEERGWCQGTMSKDGMYCAVGAIADATEYENPIMNEVIGRLKAHIGTGSLPKWNDCKTQTAENVVRKMRDCAGV